MRALRVVSSCTLVLHLLPCISSIPEKVFGVPFLQSRSWFKKIPHIHDWKQQKSSQSWLCCSLPFALSGGYQTDSLNDTDEQDEERYSRQFYTLGARAHGLVRAATVYIDGPTSSGLVYECGKNLALSGVGHIVILTNDAEEDGDEKYHDKQLDDLGRAYEKAARSELGLRLEEENDSGDILVEYLQRLNPSVDVSKKARSDLEDGKDLKEGILLCVDRPQSTQLHLNYICRKGNMRFIALETAGVYGRVFCDFGPSFEVFDADGETPLVVPLDHVEASGEGIKVCCVEGEKHDVSKGDEIVFQLGDGSNLPINCTVTDVLTPTTFMVYPKLSEGVSLSKCVDEINQDASCFSRVKIPQELTFQPLDMALEKCKEDASLFASCDLDKSLDPTRKSALLRSFDAVQAFLRSHGRLPSKDDSTEFISIAQSLIEAEANEDVDKQRWENIVSSFASCCQAKFTPIQAMFGAIGAQEALKAVSGLYSPIKQFLLYDCDEILVVPSSGAGEPLVCENDAPGQSYILGKSLTEKLASSRLFVVGAGAIGCELLKNLAAMGGGTGIGCIIVTDMDTIERSNLSRQLLFRDSDIGSFKSTAAQRAVLRLNPAANMEVHTSKVGDNHGPFDDQFWSDGMDMVLNALDNVEARIFIDGQCVAHRKALVDAGTQGSKGNVQVVVPGQSESYGASADPPEQAIPVCTLKNFPYAIAHTIQWGRDMFDGYFQRRPAQANDHAVRFTEMTSLDFAKGLVSKLGDDAAFEAAEELVEDLGFEGGGGDDPMTSYRQSSISWAVGTAKKLFHDEIEDLLRQHPRDSLDEDGEPFWSGTRRIPQRLSYSASEEVDSNQAMINENLVEFVRTAARLRIESFVEISKSGESLVSVEDAVSALIDCDWESVTTQNTDETDRDVVTRIEALISSKNSRTTPKLRAVEFEKDDETNGHVSFVTAASNLRAICYGIPPVDAMETRRVAGNIVPAMITTTAFVSAQSCIELLKLLQQAPLKLHRNAFINLALPFFAFTQPLPADEMPGLRGEMHTLWDRIIVKEGKKSAVQGGMTLRRFLKQIRKKASSNPDSVVICTLSYGPYMVYANFLHDDDDRLLNRPFLELLKEAIVTGNEFDDEFSRDDNNGALVSAEVENVDDRMFIDLTVVVEEQETGEEVELPPVRFVKNKQK